MFTTPPGNAGNGSNPQPDGVILGAGAQIITPASSPEVAQTPGTPTPVASFSVTQLGAKADKVGKDDNFRGLTIFNNVLYYTKGSGGNGVNTVYFVDTTGTACPNGVGVPVANAALPSTPLTLQNGSLPNNMCILAGFPSTPNKAATTVAAPFGLWFADANTLYVADEGDGYTGGADLYTHAAAQTTAGLQKWVFNSSSNTWTLAYTLQNGLKAIRPRERKPDDAGDFRFPPDALFTADAFRRLGLEVRYRPVLSSRRFHLCADIDPAKTRIANLVAWKKSTSARSWRCFPIIGIRAWWAN